MTATARVLSAMLTLTAGTAALAQVHDPWVKTDRSVDCRSRDTILADILKPGMTDEQKAVAIWRFMMDHTWHFSRPDDNTPLRVLNVYGYALCGTLSRVQNWLRRGAFPPSYVAGGGCSRYGSTRAERERIARGWLIDSWTRIDGGQDRPGAGNLGHSMGEVFYDGRWHFLDCHGGFFVYTADKTRIAGYDDLMSDPTLVSDPVKTSEPFMPYDEGMPLFYYRLSGNGGRGIPDPAAKPKETAAPDPSMGVVLRPGETYTRMWHPIAGAFKWSGSWAKQWTKEYIGAGPRHVPSGPDTWRRYANGTFVYTVPLQSSAAKEGLTALENAAFRFEDGRGPALHAADPAKPMSFAVDVTSPYVLISASVTGSVVVPAGGKASLALVLGSSRSVVWQSETAGPAKMKVALGENLKYGYQYRLAFTFTGGGGVDDVRVETVVQLNPLTLPRLRPGRNTVTVTSADPDDLRRHALIVTYVWRQGTAEKTHTQRVTRSPETYVVEVGKVTTSDPLDPSYMQELRLEVPADGP